MGFFFESSDQSQLLGDKHRRLSRRATMFHKEVVVVGGCVGGVGGVR